MHEFNLGIVEGFYGTPYSKSVREYLMKRCASFGYSFYIYAPKNDISLRRKWNFDFKENEISNISCMAACAHSFGLNFSVALSPLGICNTGASGEEKLLKKFRTLENLNACDFYALFFDDIPADRADLGKKQNAIIKALHKTRSNRHGKILVCPSFYSFDPVLERIFGKMPPDYFSELTKDLDDDVCFFWTGNQVLSQDINIADIKKAEKITGSRLALWDNYPVNDGKKISAYLFTAPFKGRNTLSYLKDFTHAVNPMCEGLLSTAPLSSLPLIYQHADEKQIQNAWDHEGQILFGKNFDKFKPYLEKLQTQGLDAIDRFEKQKLKSLCLETNTAAASELLDFLNGKYAFDPQCLTS